MEIKPGDLVKLKKTELKRYYHNVEFLKDMHTVGGKESFSTIKNIKDIIVEYIAIAGVGEVLYLNDTGDPRVKFCNTLNNKKYTYDHYFDKDGIKIVKS